MKLKSLLVQIMEGTCERLPNESDEDFLTRCGNDMFNQKASDKLNQSNGTFTRPVVNEFGTKHGYGLDSPMIKLVFWDEKNGLKDEKKIKEILRVLERNLKVLRSGEYNYNTSDIINSFKYFPATSKLIGNFPKNIFLNANARRGGHYAISLRNCRFEDELRKISPTLDVKEKV